MIWVDITNLPHVLFFRDFINTHDCLVTTRDFGHLTDLLEHNNIEYTSVGRHGGSDKYSKLSESAKRVEELAKIISGDDIEYAVSKHSVELPRVAYGLGIESIFVLDNEHAVQQNRLTLPLVDNLITPEGLSKDIISGQGANMDGLQSFKGVCEASHLNSFKPSDAFKEYGEYVIVRPEPYMASYFKDKAQTQSLINTLSSSGYEVLVLPRDKEVYENAVHLENIDSLNLIYHSKAFFGGGGTMNREAAILGVPAFSFYSQKLLGVDRFLIKEGLLRHITDLDSLDLDSGFEDNREKAKKLRETFEDPFKIVENIIS